MLILLAVSAFSQTPNLASAIYAENGELIGVTNLSGLEDCSTANLLGKVKNIKPADPTITFELRTKRERQTIQVNLERLSAKDRPFFFQDLVKKGRSLRVSGYKCGANNFINAISIDRNY